MAASGGFVIDSDAVQTVDTVDSSLLSVVDPGVEPVWTSVVMKALVVVEPVPSSVNTVSSGSVTVESNTETPLSIDTS